MNPVDGVITSSFGIRFNPINKKKEFHDGLDIGVPEGAEIFAVSGGLIKSVGKSNSFGNFILYKTNNGYEIFNAHLKKILVKENDTIKQNQVIGLAGKSGFATGPHLHYSIKRENKFLDPIDFVDLPYTNDVQNEYIMRGVALN